MAFALAGAAFAGVAAVLAAPTLGSRWLSWVVGGFGCLLGLVAIGSIGFSLWGKYPGFNWHFTP